MVWWCGGVYCKATSTRGVQRAQLRVVWTHWCRIQHYNRATRAVFLAWRTAAAEAKVHTPRPVLAGSHMIIYIYIYVYIYIYNMSVGFSRLANTA
jgi:hypothetical protein